MKAVLLFKQSTTSAIGLACYMGWFSDATSALIRIAPLPPPLKPVVFTHAKKKRLNSRVKLRTAHGFRLGSRRARSFIPLGPLATL